MFLPSALASIVITTGSVYRAARNGTYPQPSATSTPAVPDVSTIARQENHIWPMLFVAFCFGLGMIIPREEDTNEQT